MRTIRLTLVMGVLLLGIHTLRATDDVGMIVMEGLNKLPLQDTQSYNEVMESMAVAGKNAIILIADQMNAAEWDQRSKLEYAIDGVVDYTMMTGKKKYRSGVVNGLTTALYNCSDNPNKAFLLSELQKCATAREFDVFRRYLSDPYLQDYAISGIAQLKGIDRQTVKLIKAEAAPREKLAYLAYFKQLKGVEKTLLNWLPDADEKTKASIYMALITCGSERSLKVLQEAAHDVGYKTDATGVMDAYLRLAEKMVKK